MHLKCQITNSKNILFAYANLCKLGDYSVNTFMQDAEPPKGHAYQNSLQYHQLLSWYQILPHQSQFHQCMAPTLNFMVWQKPLQIMTKPLGSESSCLTTQQPETGTI